eukprot:jgi/Mesvir1/18699/Mv17185-RA.1
MKANGASALATCLALLLVRHAYGFCSPGLPCWPTAAQVAALRLKLNPEANRTLAWSGPGTPYPTAIPVLSPDDQPFYGYGGSGLEPIYEETAADAAHTCFANQEEKSDYCFVTIRNGPAEGWQPAFVVFPTAWQHVQETMLFAVAHNLKVCVAGTGHDFLNRHSCDAGILIRTVFLKGAEFDLTDAKHLGSPSVRLGSGMVFGEAHKAVAEKGKLITSGWAATVGVVGWSLGGGHGPMVPSHGLGVDNILEIELIAANGDRVIANAAGTSRQSPNSTLWTHDPSAELWLAMRGGGGSTWGVVTAITLRIHDIPAGGFTRASVEWQGLYCEAGITQLNTLVDTYFAWAQTLDSKWGGLNFFTPAHIQDSSCNTSWSVSAKYYYQGSVNDTAFRTKWAELSSMLPDKRTLLTLESFATWWDVGKTLALEPIIPVYNAYGYYPGFYEGGIPSVMLSREVIANGTVTTLIKRHLALCQQTGNYCTQFQAYQDITGNLGSLDLLGAAVSNVSVSPGMRYGLIHLVFTVTRPDYLRELYALGANSYFSESAYVLGDWKTRYYGDNYARLQAVKTAMDPDNRLTCHHCVDAFNTASPPPPPPPQPPSSAPSPPSSAAEGLHALGQMATALAAAMIYFLFHA